MIGLLLDFGLPLRPFSCAGNELSLLFVEMFYGVAQRRSTLLGLHAALAAPAPETLFLRVAWIQASATKACTTNATVNDTITSVATCPSVCTPTISSAGMEIRRVVAMASDMAKARPIHSRCMATLPARTWRKPLPRAKRNRSPKDPTTTLSDQPAAGITTAINTPAAPTRRPIATSTLPAQRW